MDTLVPVLNTHVKMKHDTSEGTTKCPLCDLIGNRNKIVRHLGMLHKVRGVKWNANRNQYIVPEQFRHE